MPKSIIATEEESVVVTLRMPVSMKDQLAIIAKKDHRTLSDQIRYFIERAIQTQETPSPSDKKHLG